MAGANAALLLAGGASSRMGRPKPWLDRDGTPLLRYLIEVARRSVPVVIVVAAPGQDLPALPPGVTRLDDPPHRAGRGPLAGTLTGLEHLAELGADTTYVGACDTPWLDPEHVDFVLRTLEDHPGRAAAVPRDTPTADGVETIHVLSGAVRVGPAIVATRSLLASDRGSMRALYEALDALWIDVERLPRPDVVRGCNSPEQWKAAVAALRANADRGPA